MSDVLDEGPPRREVTAFEVANFLRRNPDFLSGFPELTLSLRIPRTEGPTTSLASYQLDVLRDKNRALNRRLQELIAIAGDNEQLVGRVHALTLALMRARGASDTLARVVATLTEDFHTELVQVLLFHGVVDQPDGEWLTVLPRESRALAPLADFIARGEPQCGRHATDQMVLLFGDRASEVKSSALIPVPGHGLLAVGSLDANRFHPGMGTLFLKLIADALAEGLERFAGDARAAGT